MGSGESKQSKHDKAIAKVKKPPEAYQYVDSAVSPDTWTPVDNTRPSNNVFLDERRFRVVVEKYPPDVDPQVPGGPSQRVVSGALRVDCGDMVQVVDDSGDQAFVTVDTDSGARGQVPASCLSIIKELTQYTWYHGDKSRDKSEELLNTCINGAYLVRQSETHAGLWTVSCRSDDKIHHYRINSSVELGVNMLYVVKEMKFISLAELVHYHAQHSGGLATRLIYPASKGHSPNSTSGDLSGEVDRARLNMCNRIGGGQYGDVYLAKYHTTNGMEHVVAVKTLRESDRRLEKNFIKEAQIMQQLQHPHLVKLHGVCTRERPILIITEYMPNGDLLNFLEVVKKDLSSNTLIYMAVQIADAMRYLETKNFVHRDLAARNCLVGDRYLVKVSDFGLARLVNEGRQEYTCTNTEEQFPIKWTAPEGLAFHQFSTKSDVWSFGVLLWEIATYGMRPYPGVQMGDLYQYLEKGNRLNMPANCPDDIYQIMKKCWMWEPIERPSFASLYSELKTMEERYAAVDDEPLPPYPNNDGFRAYEVVPVVPLPPLRSNTPLSHQVGFSPAAAALGGMGGEMPSTFTPQSRKPYVPATVPSPYGSDPTFPAPPKFESPVVKPITTPDRAAFTANLSASSSPPVRPRSSSTIVDGAHISDRQKKRTMIRTVAPADLERTSPKVAHRRYQSMNIKMAPTDNELSSKLSKWRDRSDKPESMSASTSNLPSATEQVKSADAMPDSVETAKPPMVTRTEADSTPPAVTRKSSATSPRTALKSNAFKAKPVMRVKPTFKTGDTTTFSRTEWGSRSLPPAARVSNGHVAVGPTDENIPELSKEELSADIRTLATNLKNELSADSADRFATASDISESLHERCQMYLDFIDNMILKTRFRELLETATRDAKPLRTFNPTAADVHKLGITMQSLLVALDKS